MPDARFCAHGYEREPLKERDLRKDVLRLVEATESDWAWLCVERPNDRDWLLPKDGVGDLAMLRLLRRITRDLRNAGSPHSYLIVHANEIVGLCGYKHQPRSDKTVEIGFGIAAARRNLGYATRAVALLLEQAARDESVRTVFAETHVDNLASKNVLRRNGFATCGRRFDREEGDLITWRAAIPRC
jgi:RimJ/RimL family protein N-acetyltransferase